MRLSVLLAATAIGLPLAATAQQPLPATTVQLPTFSVFTVRTTVSVPDSGLMNMGGVSRAADGRVTRGLGPLASRGIGGERSSKGASVSATIIDHAEIDRAVLAAAAGREPADAGKAKADALARSVGKITSPPSSVAAIREANRIEDEREAAELAKLFAKAEQAEAEGKAAVAKVYYQMVARRDRGQLQSLAQQRLAALQRK
jgi:hypothetical protein